MERSKGVIGGGPWVSKVGHGRTWKSITIEGGYARSWRLIEVTESVEGIEVRRQVMGDHGDQLRARGVMGHHRNQSRFREVMGDHGNPPKG